MAIRKFWAVPIVALAIAGCAPDGEPLGPEPGVGLQDGLQVTLSCRADIRGGGLSCTVPGGELGGASGVLIGNQGEHVLLESKDVGYDPADPDGPVFRASVSVRNYLTQPLGTTDGLSADQDGIRIFFLSDPVVTAGTGAVTVRNADGTAEFTQAGQPYFQYDGNLASGQTSSSKVWEWDVPETVDAFTFLVGVSAALPDENDLVPGTHLQASALAVGHFFTCALDMQGKAYCWGVNDAGQLGIGAAENRTSPVPVAGGHTFIFLHAGQEHACGITPDNDAYCWGNGANYRLGQGTTSTEFQPVAVGGGVKFKTISAGAALTCGISLDDDVYCWGSNGNAKTGQGVTGGNTMVPTKINGDYKYKWVSAGYFQACGVTTDDEAVCWGNGSLGRSGDGITTAHNLFTPTPILVDEKFSVIETGSAYTCGLTLDGEAYCFGVGGSGQTGAGVIDTSGIPRKVLGDHKFSTIAVRFAHTCATKANGEAWCWGNAGHGRLGDGSTTNQSVPGKVQSDVEFAYVGVGHAHTCGLSTSGTVYCWGNGEHGRLGTGNAENRSYPTPVSILPPTSP